GVEGLLTRIEISNKVDARLFFCGISACCYELAVQFPKLLVIECDCRTTARKPMILAKLCYCFIRVAKLTAQFNQAVAQPTRGSFGRLKTSVELVNDIGIGYRVGKLTGSHGIVPSDGNVEYLSPPAARDRQSSPQAVYTVIDGCFRRCLILCALHCGPRFTRWDKFLDGDPSQQRIGPQDGKLVLGIVVKAHAAFVTDSIQGWGFLVLHKQHLSCRGVQRGCPHEIDHTHEERKCCN